MKRLYQSFIYVGLVACLGLGLADTAKAQNNTLSVTPTQLNFNTQVGVNPAAQTLTLSTTAGPVDYTATASASWVQVNGSSSATGNTATAPTLSVSTMASGCSGGSTCVAFVNIASSAGNVYVPVQLTVGTTTPTTLSANPPSLTFTFAPGSITPQTQMVVVNNSGGSVNVTASASTGNAGGTWLTVGPTGAIGTPATLSVTVNPSTLMSGNTYSGSIVVNPQGGGTGLSIPVNVTVGGVPTIAVAPAQLSFGYQIGTSTPPAQILSVTSSNGQSIAYTTTVIQNTGTSNCGTNWLVVSPQNSATGSPVSVQVNTNLLTANTTCSGEIDIATTGTTNPTVKVPVSLLVSTLPILNVSTTGLSFTYQPGGTIPQPQTFQVSTSSTTPLTFSVAATSGTAGAQNFLTLNQTTTTATSTAPAPVTVLLNPNVLPLLAPGVYTANVAVTASGAANSPISFPVTLTVSNNSTLTVNQASATFNYQIGQAPPASQVITVSSTGAPLTFTAAATTTNANCGNFLSVTQSSPTTQVGTGQPTTLVLAASIPGGTAAGTCTGSVTLTPAGSSTPAVTIPVTVNVSNTPLINVSPTAISALVPAGSTTPVMQTIALTSTDLATMLNVQAIATTTPAGQTWLTVTPNQTSTGSNLFVQLNPTGLPAGTYTGSINISSSAPNVPAQSIPVTLVIASAQVTFAPGSLTFSQAVAGPAPAAQTITLTGVPAGVSIGAIATTYNGGTGWLTASAGANNIVSVSVNGAQLQQGTYNGTVTVIVPGAANSPINIPVTFTVGAAVTLGVNPAAVNFTYTAGSSTTPQAQTVQLTSTGGNVPFTVNVATTNNTNFLSVTPLSGTTTGSTPVSIVIGLNQTVLSTLAPNTYTGTVTISSPNAPGGDQKITVTLTVAQAPPPALTFVLNAATLLPGPVSPGELVAIKGTGLGPATPLQTQLTSNGMVSTSLGGVQVFFGNVAAPLTYVSDTQINAVVPYEVTGQATVNVTVNYKGVTSASGIPQVVTATSPGFFTNSGMGFGQAAVLNQDLSRNGASNPAAKGSVIVLYGTGEGQLINGGVTGSVTPLAGPYPMPQATPVTVTIGGVQAVTQFIGEAPGLVSGVIQINAVVPASVASGNQPVTLTIGNVTSRSDVTIAIQ